MKRPAALFVLLLVLGQFPSLISGMKDPCTRPETFPLPGTVIEDFDDGILELTSYPGEDQQPSAWELNSQITYGNSPWSLKLSGNTWKVENIQPVMIDTGDVWQVSAYIASTAEIQAFGVMDSVHELFYSFAGTEQVEGDRWVNVYQGSLPGQQWNVYQLPVADDWLAVYGYLPVITSLVYINDKDNTTLGAVYFDYIVDITGDLPIAPQVSVSYIITDKQGYKHGESVEVQFLSAVTDPDSEEHDYYWDFGDDSTSAENNPLHTFLVSDDHPYTVLLQVADSTDKWGEASCSVAVDPGGSSFPVTLNFVGDIMMARRYEEPGGIIPTQGVEAIFEPTLPWLGEAADITVANLECALTTYTQHHPTKPIYFKSSPANVTGLTYAGIDIITIANNHIIDYLQPGMNQTRDVLKANGLIFSGAGDDSYEAYRPAFYSKSGVNFAFLEASDRTGAYDNYQPYLNAGFNKPGFANLTEYYCKKQIDEVKDVSDLVVMEWHSGNEYSFVPAKEGETALPFPEEDYGDEGYSPLADSPSEGDIEIRHAAVDDGADLIICHHPHIIQGVELYNGRLIAHSLGNFVFDLLYPETFPSMILNAKVNETGFYEFTVVPVYIDDFIPRRATGELGLYLLDDLARRSKDLDTYLRVDRDSVVATVIMDTSNMIPFSTENIVQLVLEQVGSDWETPPCRLARTGSISSINSIEPPDAYACRLGRELLWSGNMEDEGCTLWYLNNSFEVYCDTVAYAGERSLQHQRDENSPYDLVTNLENRIMCRSDTLKYSLCGYIKTLNGANVTIEVQYYVSRTATTPLGQENIGTLVNGNTPWAFYHHDLTIPAGTKFFDVRLVSQIPASGTAFSWFDNVGLVQWDGWKNFDGPQSIDTPNDYYFLQVRSTQNMNEVIVDYSETVYDKNTVGIASPACPSAAMPGLKQNYPNPFKPGNGPTSIPFSLKQKGRASLVIYDMQGRVVKVLADEVFDEGTHCLYWDGCNSQGHPVSPGIYFFQLESRGLKQARKCVVLPL
jgi:poly-gamma-glutamate synthesis protein (capsule biosynthesis protein)